MFQIHSCKKIIPNFWKTLNKVKNDYNIISKKLLTKGQ
ncbi:hypothetical protein BSR25_2144 [Lactococcus lactis subsp. lactis bv. diacetylactis]|nr:hypothetical protein BSR25_2144 [Lactococcus lactis subsp. lactis bv. diacetylactis]